MACYETHSKDLTAYYNCFEKIDTQNRLDLSKFTAKYSISDVSQSFRINLWDVKKPVL